MVKYILTLSFIMAVASTMPVEVSARNMAEMEIMDNNDLGRVVVTVNGSTLRIVGAENLTLCVYNIAGGQPVLKSKIDSQDKTFDMNLPKGVYIVQVGNKATRKIVIR